MSTVPDAPWIREAEIDGWGTEDLPIICPVCGQECERIYFIKGNRETIGCENCIDWEPAEIFMEG